MKTNASKGPAVLDVTFLGALTAGLLSFLSPCILPMVPFYLSYLAGTSVHAAVDGGTLPEGTRRRATVSALLFAAGVVTVFVALGATASAAGALVREWFDVLRWMAAGLLLAMGLHFLGVVRIGLLNRTVRMEAGDTGRASYGGAYLIGLAFAFGWTPCVGPVLAAILMLAGGNAALMGEGGVARGTLLLLAYGVGMTAPFVAAAFAIGPFLRFMARFRRHLGAVEKAMGVLLIAFAALIATNGMSLIAYWMLETFPVFGRIG